MQEKLKLNEIIIEDRYRKDYGDVKDLALSIASNGLLHPVVVDSDNRLVAGGRRFAAFTLLASGQVTGVDGLAFGEVPITRFGALDEGQRKLLELEENIRRKDTTWQEQVLGLYDYHKICHRKALKRNDKWTQAMTGSLLNMDQGPVSTMLMVASALLKDKEDPIKDCANLSDAVRTLMQRKQDEAAQEQLKRINAKREQMLKDRELNSARVEVPADLTAVAGVSSVSGPTSTPSSGGDRITSLLSNSTGKKQLVTKEQIASFYYHGSALDLLPRIASQTTINHIICDPPYGIDMSNLSGANIARVEETHEVEPNKQLLKAFLDVAYSSLAADGFLCMWYDLDHHEKLQEWAKQIGFKVCRWPFTWCKSSPCSNQASQYNITKSTEVCMLLRKSEQSVIKTKQSRNWLVSTSASTSTHPFVKPFDIWKYLIETVSVEGQTIVDPFAGEGSSLAASFRLGRNPIGIEIDDKHIANGLEYVSSQINDSGNSPVSSIADIISSSLDDIPDAPLPL